MMNSASGGGALAGAGRAGGTAPPTFSAPSGPLSGPAPPGPLSGPSGPTPHLSGGQFGGAGPVQGQGGFPVIPPGIQGSAFPIGPSMAPKPAPYIGPHLPPSGSFGSNPQPGMGPTIL